VTWFRPAPSLRVVLADMRIKNRSIREAEPQSEQVGISVLVMVASFT
jgi:hypothetical protein